MPRRTLNDEQDAYLRSIAPGKSISECTDMLNARFGSQITLSQIRSYKNNHKISSGVPSWKFVDHSKQRMLNEEQHNWLSENAIGKSNAEITKMLNKKFDTAFTSVQIDSYKGNHGINSGLTGHFPKGHVPLNKGTKGMFNVGGNKTSFKAGSKPLNMDPIGTEKLLPDGYVWVKINDVPKAKKYVNWDQKHRIIYEQHHGAIPKKHVVIFADGNRENFDIDNLVLVSKSELLIMNKKKLINTNSDLTKTGVIMAKLIDRTNKVANRQNDE